MPKRRASDEDAISTPKRCRGIDVAVPRLGDEVYEKLVPAFGRLRVRTSLEDLPEDILLMIIEALIPPLPLSTFSTSRKAEWLAFFDSRHSLYALARVSKNLLCLVRPFLYRNICVLRQRSALDLVVHFLTAPALASRVRNVFVSPHTMKDQPFSWTRERATTQKLKGLQGGLVEWLRPRLAGAVQRDHLPNLLLFTLVSLMPRLEQLQLDLGELAGEPDDYHIEPPDVQMRGYFFQKGEHFANPNTMPLSEWGAGIDGAPFLPNPRLRSVLVFHGLPNCSVTLELSPKMSSQKDKELLGGVDVKNRRATFDLCMLLREPDLIDVLSGAEGLHSIDILSEDGGKSLASPDSARIWFRRVMVLERLWPVAKSLARLRLGFRLTSAERHMMYACAPARDGRLLQPFARLRELVVPTQAWPGPWEKFSKTFTATDEEKDETSVLDGNSSDDNDNDTVIERMAGGLPRSLESLRLLEWWSAYAEERSMFWGKPWVLQEQRVHVIVRGLAGLRTALKRRCPRLHDLVFEAHVWQSWEPNVYWQNWLRGSGYGALVEEYKRTGITLRVEMDR